MRAILLAFVLIHAASAEAADGREIVPPSGWRKIDMNDLGNAKAREFRSASPVAFLSTVADFDGDGTRDIAVLLIGDEKVGVFVLASQPDVPPRLIATRPKQDLQNLGLTNVKPGSYKTACGKGLGSKATCDRDEVVLSHPGIELFTHESASTYFHWDRQTFVETSISD